MCNNRITLAFAPCVISSPKSHLIRLGLGLMGEPTDCVHAFLVVNSYLVEMCYTGKYATAERMQIGIDLRKANNNIVAAEGFSSSVIQGIEDRFNEYPDAYGSRYIDGIRTGLGLPTKHATCFSFITYLLGVEPLPNKYYRPDTPTSVIETFKQFTHYALSA